MHLFLLRNDAHLRSHQMLQLLECCNTFNLLRAENQTKKKKMLRSDVHSHNV